MKDFAAIDFETANAQRSSVCSVGVVFVKGGVIEEKFYSLIRPEPNYYSYFNTRVHGLTEFDTDSAPIFPEVWARLEPKLRGLPLVAHNSPFDSGCLRAVLCSYSMDCPDFKFHCTCKAARGALGKSLPDHKLGTVAAYCGFDLRNHHHALADAEACAHIALRFL